MNPSRLGSGVALGTVVGLLAALGCQDDGQPVAAAQVTGGDDETARSGCWAAARSVHWVEEGDALTLPVHCFGHLAPKGSVTVTGLPAGAAHDAQRGLVTWTPALDQAGVYRMELALAGSEERGSMIIGVADRFDDPANLPIASASAYTEEMGLPVIHLAVTADPKHEEYAPATIVFRGRTWQAEVKLRGNSSLEYPKTHYTVRFAKNDPFDDPTGGFRQRRRLVLRSGFDDNSRLRDRLALELWNRLEGARVQLRHASAVLYLNGAYVGLYTMADHIDGDLMAAHGLDGDGSLYKAIRPEANFHTGMAIEEVFEKKEGSSPGFQDLTALAAFVRDADDASFSAEIADHVDLASYGAWYVLATAIMATDSLSKNTYHHLQPGERWRVVPWDFNGSFGQDWATHRLDAEPAPEALAEVNLLLKRIAGGPGLSDATRARFARALEGPLLEGAVLRILDRFADEVAAAVPRDERRWGHEYRKFYRWSQRSDFTDFSGEVAYMRAWIGKRWAALARHLAAPPAPAIE